MKNNIAMILLAVLAVLSATAVSAQLTVSDVTFGDASQERNENVSRTITVTNPTASPVTFDKLTFISPTGADLSQFKFVVSLTGNTVTQSGNTFTFVTTPVSVAGNNGQVQITFQAFVPKNHNAVDAGLNEVASQIATASAFSGATAVTTTAGKVSMQAKNKLTVDDMNIIVNGESQSISNNERVDNLKPGDKLDLEVVVKNQYSDRSDIDIDIDDVVVDVISSDLDELDLDEEEDIGTLGAKSDDSATFKFDVEDDTDDATYTLTVKVSGVDQNGAKHGEVQTIRLKVERETHDISFKRVEVVPSSVECDGSRLVTVDATLTNIGKRDEDNVVVQADVPQLKFSKKLTGLKLDDGRSKTVQFAIDVPEDSNAGTYRVELASFFENTIKSHAKSVSFDVAQCEEAVDEAPVVGIPPAPVTPPAPAPQPQPTTTPAPRVSVSQKSFTDSTLYIYVLAGASGFLFLLLVVTLLVLVSRRRRDDE